MTSTCVECAEAGEPRCLSARQMCSDGTCRFALPTGTFEGLCACIRHHAIVEFGNSEHRTVG